MSTKNLRGSPAELTAFFAVSLVIHIAILWFFNAFGPAYGHLFSRLLEKEPVEVEVVELPPPSPSDEEARNPIARDKITRFADRESRVDKETFPERTPNALIVRRGSTPPPKGKKGAPRRDTAKKDEGLKKTTAPAPVKKDGAEAKAAANGNGQYLKETVAAAKTPDKEMAASNGSQAQSGDEGEKGASKAPPFKPNLLLPDERIAELTKQYESTEQKGEKGKTLQLNTAELRYQKYIINIKNKIELHWEYPEAAAKHGWQGKLQINFTIRKDGTFEEISLVKSSGYPALDDAAVTALKLAAPFPPFPENFGIDELSIRGQFEYSIIYVPPRR